MKIAAPAAIAIAFAFTVPAIAQPAPSADTARRIAMSQGMAIVEDIDQTDGVWEVEGKDIDGYDMDIDIDSVTGRILAIKTDEAPSRPAASATLFPR